MIIQAQFLRRLNLEQDRGSLLVIAEVKQGIGFLVAQPRRSAARRRRSAKPRQRFAIESCAVENLHGHR